jgi:hypothetical protein
MTLSITKIPNNSVAVNINLLASEKPVLLHRVNVQWLDKQGKTFAANSFRPDQFFEGPINIVVASMPIVAGAAQVKATANFEVINEVATSPVLAL